MDIYIGIATFQKLAFQEMVEFCSLAALTTCFAICLGLFWWYRRPSNMPPGPRGFPLVGIIPFLGAYPERKLAKLAKTYGSIISARFGRQEWVVLNDYDAINEALVKGKQTFSGRPVIPVYEMVTFGNGILLLDAGMKWKAQRKFGLMTLRDFGMGKRSMEERVLEEAAYMNEEIRKHQGTPFYMMEILANTASNVICRVVFGRRFHYDDPWFTTLLHIVEKWFTDQKMSRVLSLLSFLPWLHYVPPFNGMMKELHADVTYLIREFAKEVHEHEESHQEDELRDFIDAFLVEMHEKNDTFTLTQLLYYIRDLFVAGTETTSSYLRWAILCLVHNPETQEKIYNEIIQEIGENGKLSMSLGDNMPYTSAFIYELQRYRTIVPLSIPHCTSDDTNVSGFKIPKSTTVIANIWAVHNDPNLWDEPEKFKPERHLDSDGRFVKSKYVIPFSVGPRHCLGKLLAQIEVFIFLTSMVQKFEFLPEPGNLPEIENGSNGNVFTPYPYKIVAQERQ